MPVWIRVLVFILCLQPLVLLLWAAVAQQLGPDPAEALMHAAGEWAARFLALTLLVSPLRSWLDWPPLLRLRRMLGLFAFFYACLHLLLFLHYYLGWEGARVWEELRERPYIAVGFVAWLILLPLAVTSTRAMQRRLGRHWGLLHRGIYGVAALVCLHVLWQARSDLGEALVWLLVFGGLLGWRLIRYGKKHRGASNAKLLDAGGG